MADIFVDGSLLANITNGSYSIANRDDSGSDGNAYITANDAMLSAVTGIDTIFVREGDSPIHATTYLNVNKAVPILRYNNEDAWLVCNEGQHGMLLGANAAGLIYDVKLKDGGGNDKRAFYLNTAITVLTPNLEIKNFKGQAVYSSNGGIITAGIIKISDMPDTGTVNKSHALTTINGTITADVYEANEIYGYFITMVNVADVITIGQVTINGGCSDSVAGTKGAITVNAGILEIHNILLINIGEEWLSRYAIVNVAGTVTLHEGIINGNVNRPWDYLTSGTIVMGNVLTNQFVDFETNGLDTIAATFVLTDSNHADLDTDSYKTYSDAFAAHGKSATWLPDDQRTWDAVGKTNRAKYWISNGMELGCEGESSSEMNVLSPLNVAYTGADTNVNLTISDTGSHLSVDGDAGNIANIDITFDGSGTGTHTPYIRSAIAGLIQTLDGIVDITAISNGDPANWDDTQSDILEDGIYDLSAGAKDIIMNRERYFVLEIDGTKEATKSLVGIIPVAYFQALYSGGESDVRTRLKAQGFVCAIGQDINSGDQFNKIADGGINLYNLAVHTEQSYFVGSDYVKATHGSSRIEGYFNVWKTFAKRYGGWGIFRLNKNYWDADEIGYMLIALDSLNVPVVNLSAGVKFFNAYKKEDIASSENAFEYAQSQAKNSVGIGIGYKWWGNNPNPVGADGEPFSDFHTDIGSVQSTHSPFHPVNL